MRASIKQLSTQEREVLAHFYDSAPYKVLAKLISIERIELAKDTAEINGTMEEIALQNRYLTGQQYGLKRLVGELRDNFRDVNNKEQKS